MIENRPWLTYFAHGVLIIGILMIGFPQQIIKYLANIRRGMGDLRFTIFSGLQIVTTSNHF